MAGRAFMGLMWLYVLGVAVQFFLAGLGTLGGESMDAHEGLGYAGLHLTPILILIVGLVGRLPRDLLVLTFVFAIVSFVQPIWVAEFEGEILGAFHVLGALVIFAMAHMIAQRATAFVRAG